MFGCFYKVLVLDILTLHICFITHEFVSIFWSIEHGLNIVTTITQAYDWFVPHRCIADWWMKSTVRAWKSCLKKSLSLCAIIMCPPLTWGRNISSALGGQIRTVSSSAKKHHLFLINFEQSTSRLWHPIVSLCLPVVCCCKTPLERHWTVNPYLMNFVKI